MQGKDGADVDLDVGSCGSWDSSRSDLVCLIYCKNYFNDI